MCLIIRPSSILYSTKPIVKEIFNQILDFSYQSKCSQALTLNNLALANKPVVKVCLLLPKIYFSCKMASRIALIVHPLGFFFNSDYASFFQKAEGLSPAN